MRSCIVCILAGLWMMISPAIFDMSKSTADINHICGPLAITFAIIALWDINRVVIKTNFLVAIAIVFATLYIKPNTPVLVSNLLSSFIMLACAFVKNTAQQSFGGGWRSLFQKKTAHLIEAEHNEE